MAALVLGIGFEIYYFVHYRSKENHGPKQADPLYLGIESFVMEFVFNVRLMGFALAPLIDDPCFCRFLVLTDAFMILFGRWLSLIQNAIDVDLIRIGLLWSHHARSFIF